MMIGASVCIANRCGLQLRTYAISRFPKRVAGTSRTRLGIQRHNPLENDTQRNAPNVTYPDGTPKPTMSPNNAEDNDGLGRLLMHRDTLVIERQLEMLNVFVGFEQSNKYTISDTNGEPLGYIAEEPRGFLGTLSRQAFSTHRPFQAVIMDNDGVPVLWVRRPFAWINSRMFVQRLKDLSQSPYDSEPVLETFGEVQQIWHLWRRRYDLFLREQVPMELLASDETQIQPSHPVYHQIAKVDAGFLAFDFSVRNEQEIEIARIERAFRGFGREIFTDTGRYSVYFNPSGVQSSLPDVSEIPNQHLSHRISNELNIDARALLLALAVNIDFDYFSRHSRAGSGGLFHISTWE
ncbi:Scramblase-domain-containing protein [Pholiota conissans]|uniref:Phospholipid scramblase n=1 Tax=Pholiota conissans TaxID=109636 RepID=A0A9P5ZBK1_9AGAR|nr:Scramblase-domain-containing protein [Pholiota conissans]